jgi:Sulfotransferase domain
VSRRHSGEGRAIAIWGVPRSVSTAFEKTFTQLPGLRIVHEPFADCYYFGPRRRSTRYGVVPDPEACGERHALARFWPVAGETVLLKDLCFQAVRYVPDDVLAEITNTFIVRHPDLVVDSLRRLKPSFTEEELGFEALAEMFERVTGLGQQPAVVEGQAFRAEPEPVLRSFCADVGIDFQSAMLKWDDGRIRQWASHEVESQAKWHSTLEASERIEPPPSKSPPPPVELGEIYERALMTYHWVAAQAITPTDKVVV